VFTVPEAALFPGIAPAPPPPEPPAILTSTLLPVTANVLPVPIKFN